MGLRQYEVPLFAAVNGATNKTSQVVDLTNMLGFSIQVVSTGSLVGSFAVQGSNDNVENVNFTANIVNWTTIVTASVAAPGTVMINVTDSFYRWMRVVYTATSGAGSLSATMQAKGF